ncbi:hypothetical protein HYX12_01580, partial [Candidatus Woesearchaeota archaeon]|nr:hypothetical protein [Candidatus Woesearchaeota archaeon]
YVVAAPPSLANHQFYGEVIWNDTSATYRQVTATVGLQTASSNIEGVACNATACAGKYGSSQTNILRVQGTAGEIVSFKVDNSYVTNYTYAPDTATNLTLDLRVKYIPPAAACVADWNCTLWSGCVDGNKTRTCTDIKSCNASLLIKNETLACQMNATVTNKTNQPNKTDEGTNKPRVTCEYQWSCSDWGSCTNNLRTRTCSRTDTCDLKVSTQEITTADLITKPKPTETETCVSPAQPPLPPQQPTPPLETCVDGLKNQNEINVDCGGVCTACPSTPWYYWGAPLIVVVLLALGGGVYYFLQQKASLSPQQQQQLYNYVRNNQQRGLSRENIIDNLVRAGWDEKLVKKYVK